MKTIIKSKKPVPPLPKQQEKTNDTTRSDTSRIRKDGISWQSDRVNSLCGQRAHLLRREHRRKPIRSSAVARRGQTDTAWCVESSRATRARCRETQRD